MKTGQQLWLALVEKGSASASESLWKLVAISCGYNCEVQLPSGNRDKLTQMAQVLATASEKSWYESSQAQVQIPHQEEAEYDPQEICLSQRVPRKKN